MEDLKNDQKIDDMLANEELRNVVLKIFNAAFGVAFKLYKELGEENHSESASDIK